MNIAAQATNSVKLPSHKVIRQLVIDTFKEHMGKLRANLLVSDCWQSFHDVDVCIEQQH